MAKGIRFHETGGPEVLRWEELEVGDPGAGEIRIRHHAVGLNFADTYFRTGYYPAPLPAGMGVEAAGVIEAVGPGVTDFAVGDRVTYTGSPLGAYSTERVMDVAPLMRLRLVKRGPERVTLAWMPHRPASSRFRSRGGAPAGYAACAAGHRDRASRFPGRPPCRSDRPPPG